MKQFLTFGALIFHLSMFAQETKIRKEKNDTTVFLWSGLKILVMNDPQADKNVVVADTVKKYTPPPKSASFYEGIDIGVNGLMMPGGMTTNLTGNAGNLNQNYSGSWNFHLNLVEKRLNIYKKKVSLVSGIGFDFNGYSFSSKNIRMVNNTNNGELSFDTTSTLKYTKNKLRVTSVEVPLMIGFAPGRKNPDHGFKIAAGVIGSYVLNTKYKLNYESGNENTQQVIKDNFYVRPFNVKASVRVGYKGLMFYANYSLMPLFQDGKGPDVRPFEVGIVL